MTALLGAVLAACGSTSNNGLPIGTTGGNVRRHDRAGDHDAGNQPAHLRCFHHHLDHPALDHPAHDGPPHHRSSQDARDRVHPAGFDGRTAPDRHQSRGHPRGHRGPGQAAAIQRSPGG